MSSSMKKNSSVIQFKKVGKKFQKGSKLLKEALLDMFRPSSTKDFWALRNISFEVKRGESLGIIGPNGSGKSTILKLIAGVTVPTEGEVNVKGRISPLIELGAGFHPELTGRENIYLNGTILGLKRSEIDEKFPRIIKFSGLEEFIDTPVKHYSSGLYMRLAFAIAVHTEPDILLVDEILAVGDSSFRKKSFGKMQEFKKNGVTTIFVSHNLTTVSKFCDRVIYLKGGKVKGTGKPEEMIRMYEGGQA